MKMDWDERMTNTQPAANLDECKTRAMKIRTPLLDSLPYVRYPVNLSKNGIFFFLYSRNMPIIAHFKNGDGFNLAMWLNRLDPVSY